MVTAEPVIAGRSSLVLPAVVAAVVSGGLVATQGQLNGDLSTAGAGVLVSSWLSYVGTLATVLLVVAVRGSTRTTMTVLRHQGRWWWYAIGLCGIPIVLAMAGGIPIVGVATASVCSVAGQTVSGLGLDARGVGVPEPLRLTGRRVLAGVVAITGLALAVLSGSRPASVSLGTMIGVGVLLFAAGLTLAGQQAGNGQVTSIARDPVVAALTTGAGGTVGISLLLGVVAASGGLDGVTLPPLAGTWYLYLGGPLGAAITVGAAWAVRHLGTFALTLTVVGGQMATALVIDVVRGVGLHWPTLVAAAMIAAATLIAMGRRRAA
ncbi:MAG TPA: DMT family transporter [Actinotalea sp.]